MSQQHFSHSRNYSILKWLESPLTFFSDTLKKLMWRITLTAQYVVDLVTIVFFSWYKLLGKEFFITWNKRCRWPWICSTSDHLTSLQMDLDKALSDFLLNQKRLRPSICATDCQCRSWQSCDVSRQEFSSRNILGSWFDEMSRVQNSKLYTEVTVGFHTTLILNFFSNFHFSVWCVWWNWCAIGSEIPTVYIRKLWSHYIVSKNRLLLFFAVEISMRA